jgi:uncharacterized GH25 family protein
MKHLAVKFLAASTALLAVAGTASAHRAWILPSTFTYSGDEQWVTVDAAISNDLFFPNHHAIDPASITVTAPDGTLVELENAMRGEIRSMFDFKMDQQGTYRISTDSQPSYFASWTEDGERKRARGSLETLRADGIDQKPDVEISQAQRSNLSFVTLGAPSTEVFAVSGSGLELSPVTHPNDIFAGEAASFKLLLDGAPAEGIEVVVIPGNDRYRDNPAETRVTTDAEGVITFTPDRPGPYWLTANSDGTTEVDGTSMRQRSSYTMTFEALPF